MKYILYMHTGSGNHGCEAIVRTTSSLLEGPKNLVLWSGTKGEDLKYGIDSYYEKIVESEEISKYSISYFRALFKRRVLRDEQANLQIFLERLFTGNVAISVGGDNYCYPWSAELAIKLDREIRKYCKYSVLWGCSINAEAITPEVETDLKKFDLITAREQVTYELLKKINPNTVKVADSAFLLDRVDLPLPKGFQAKNTVGINISPMILKYQDDTAIIIDNYKELIRYILTQTDMSVCLIPHVVWSYNDDRKIIDILFDEYSTSDRVCRVDDGNCMELKGYIARCRFFVGARTHATIAAYSTGVPTLVVGYSVKSIGIARDLFGTDERYVLPVQTMQNRFALQNSFIWLMEQEKEIRQNLNIITSMYCDKAKEGVQALQELTGYR